jgi:hypothetical protein
MTFYWYQDVRGGEGGSSIALIPTTILLGTEQQLIQVRLCDMTCVGGNIVVMVTVVVGSSE